MAKFCTECGSAITDDMTVCPKCGTQLQPSAPQSNLETKKEEKTQPAENRPAIDPNVCPKCGAAFRPKTILRSHSHLKFNPQKRKQALIPFETTGH